MLTKEQELTKSRELRAQRKAAATPRAGGYAGDSFRGAGLKAGNPGVAEPEQAAVAAASDPGIGDKQVNALLGRVAELWDKFGSKDGSSMLATELPQLLGPGTWDAGRIWELVFQEVSTADGDHAQLVAKLMEFFKAMATPSPQVAEARLRASAIERIKSRQASGKDATIGLQLRAFAPDNAMLKAGPNDDSALLASRDTADIEKKVRRLLVQVVRKDLSDDEKRDLDRYFTRSVSSGNDDEFALLLTVAPLLVTDRINKFFDDERKQAAEKERRRVLTTLTGGALLRLGQTQANSDEIISEVVRVLDKIGLALDDEEKKAVEESLWEQRFPSDQPIAHPTRFSADRIVRARTAALKAKADSPALLSVSAKLRQAAIHDETDRRLTAAEASMDRIEARFRADREREDREMIDLELKKSRAANPRRCGNKAKT